MRKIIPTVIFFLISSVLLFVFPVAGLLAMVATAAYAINGVYRGVRNLIGRKGGAARKSRTPVRAMRDSLTRGKYHSRSRGWDLDRIPFDLRPSINGRELYLSATGIAEPIVARAGRDGTADFTFNVYGDQAIQRVASRMGNGMKGASVRRTEAGYIVSCMEVGDARDLLSAAYPQKKVDVRREQHSINQWVIAGCATFEEAKSRYMEMKKAGTLPLPDHSLVYEDITVDGKQTRRGDAEPMQRWSLAAGEWIVSEEAVQTASGEVKVCVNDTELMAREAEWKLDAAEDTVREQSSSIEDRTGDVQRTVETSEGKDVPLVKAAALGTGIAAVVCCETLSEFMDLAAAGKVPAGRFVEAGTGTPMGDMSVCIPVDSRSISALAMQEDMPSQKERLYCSLGLSREDLLASELSDACRRGTSVSVRTTGDLSLDGAVVGGVPLKEFSERLADQRLPKLDEAGARQWLTDASTIQSVSMTVDVRNRELRITSRVNDTVKVETRTLTSGEMHSLESRGRIGRAEMKDVLMQIHPDWFGTYSQKSGRRVADPLKDFIENRPPRGIAAQTAKTAGQRQKQSAKAANRMKI